MDKRFLDMALVVGVLTLATPSFAADYVWWVGTPERTGVVTVDFLLADPFGHIHHFGAQTPDPHHHPGDPNVIEAGISPCEKAERIVNVLNHLIASHFPHPGHEPIVFEVVSTPAHPDICAVAGTVHNGWVAHAAIGLGLDDTQEHSHPHAPPPHHPTHCRMSLHGEAHGETHLMVLPAPGFVELQVGTAIAVVQTTQGMTSAEIEEGLRASLAAQGVSVAWDSGPTYSGLGSFQAVGDGSALLIDLGTAQDVLLTVADLGVDVEFLTVADATLFPLVVLAGDCNQNGVVDILDSLDAAQMSLGLVTVPATDSVPFAACNVSGEMAPSPGATVTVLDALLIAQAAVGLLEL